MKPRHVSAPLITAAVRPRIPGNFDQMNGTPFWRPAAVSARRILSPGCPRRSGHKFIPVFLVLIVYPVEQLVGNLIAIDDASVAAIILLAVSGLVGIQRLGLGRARELRVVVPFWLLATASLLYATWTPYTAQKATLFLLSAVPTVFFTFALVSSGRDAKAFFVCWIWAGSVLALLIVLTNLHRGWTERWLLGEDSLATAYPIGAALTLLAVLVIFRDVGLWQALPVLVLLTGALLAIASRGPILSVIVALVAVTVLARKWRYLAVLVAGLIFGLLLSWSTMRLLQPRLTSGADPVRDALRETGFGVWLSSPIFGVGFSGLSGATSGLVDYPHNIFLEIAAELGLVGICAFLGLLAVLGLRVWSNRESVLAPLAGALSLFWLTGMQFSMDTSNRVFWLGLLSPLLLIMPSGQPAHFRRGLRTGSTCSKEPALAAPMRSIDWRRRSDVCHRRDEVHRTPI